MGRRVPPRGWNERGWNERRLPNFRSVGAYAAEFHGAFANGHGHVTPERWQQTKELLNGALDREGADREAYLNAACGNDQELRREVEDLIKANDSAGEFLEKPTTEAVPHYTRIGPYQILEELGHGGMGSMPSGRT